MHWGSPVPGERRGLRGCCRALDGSCTPLHGAGGCSALLQDQPHVVAPLGQHNSISKEAGASSPPSPHLLGSQSCSSVHQLDRVLRSHPAKKHHPQHPCHQQASSDLPRCFPDTAFQPRQENFSLPVQQGGNRQFLQLSASVTRCLGSSQSSSGCFQGNEKLFLEA